MRQAVPKKGMPSSQSIFDGVDELDMEPANSSPKPVCIPVHCEEIVEVISRRGPRLSNCQASEGDGRPALRVTVVGKAAGGVLRGSCTPALGGMRSPIAATSTCSLQVPHTFTSKVRSLLPLD